MIGDKNTDNRAALERYGETRVIGEMPRLAPLTGANAGRMERGASGSCRALVTVTRDEPRYGPR